MYCVYVAAADMGARTLRVRVCQCVFAKVSMHTFMFAEAPVAYMWEINAFPCHVKHPRDVRAVLSPCF